MVGVSFKPREITFRHVRRLVRKNRRPTSAERYELESGDLSVKQFVKKYRDKVLLHYGTNTVAVGKLEKVILS